MNRRPITQEDLGVLFILLAVLLGGWMRLYTPGLADFPMNDGGMFLVMMEALQENHFALPTHFQFNGLTLPFAYPPLGFYTGAWLSQTFHIDLISILQWLPACVLILSIPAFFWLAASLLDSKFPAGLAAFIYACTPRAANWATMGGGLTRAFGLLFLLLTLGSVLRLFKTGEKKYLPAAIIFSSLTVLSHPEAALHAAVFCFVFFLFYGRSKIGIIHTITTAIGTILLTSIWWIPILLRFGLDPYLTASQTGFHSAFALILPFILPLTDEPQMTVIAVLGLIGLVFCIARKNFLIPILYILPYISEPRSAPVYAAIFLAMLAASAISGVILPAISDQPVSQSRAALAVLAYLGLYLFGSAAFYNIQFSGNIVSEPNRKAFEWIQKNLPEDSRILVLTGESDTFCDGVSEWFPALTGRISPTTVQGKEWLPDFNSALNGQRAMQACLNADDSLGCIEANASQYQIKFDHLYIARQSTLKQLCRVVSPITRGDALIAQIKSRPDYKPVYQTSEVLIFIRAQEIR